MAATQPLIHIPIFLKEEFVTIDSRTTLPIPQQ
jgi:hypothetical protein